MADHTNGKNLSCLQLVSAIDDCMHEVSDLKTREDILNQMIAIFTAKIESLRKEKIESFKNTVSSFLSRLNNA